MEPERLCRGGILSQGRSLCRGHLGTEAWMAQGNGAKHRSAGRVFGMVGTTVQLSQGRARPTGPRDSKEEERRAELGRCQWSGLTGVCNKIGFHSKCSRKSSAYGCCVKYRRAS